MTEKQYNKIFADICEQYPHMDDLQEKFGASDWSDMNDFLADDETRDWSGMNDYLDYETPRDLERKIGAWWCLLVEKAKRKFQEIVENDETDNQDKWNSIEKLFKVKKFHPTYGSAWDFFAGDEIVGCADDTGDGVTFYLDASCHETFDDEWLND